MRLGIKRWLAPAALVVAFEARASAAPAIQLTVDSTSTCEGTSAIATRIAARGVATAADAPTKVTVRAVTTADGAEASLVIDTGGRTATRTLAAPTCDEVLDAASYTLSLALEQPEPEPEPTPPPPTPPAPPPPPPSPHPWQWGGEATFGILAGASPDVAAVFVVRADLESAADGIVAPSASLGAAIMFPSSTTSGGADLSFALQTGLLDACPIRLGARRFSLRPCAELQIGRLQSRGAGVPGSRLESSTWAALGLTLRGRAEIGAGIAAELAVTGGSPLIQDEFSVGNSRVFDTGPLLFAATFGVGVHFR